MITSEADISHNLEEALARLPDEVISSENHCDAEQRTLNELLRFVDSEEGKAAAQQVIRETSGWIAASEE